MATPSPTAVFADAWRRHRALLLPAYIGGVFVCLVAAIAGDGLHYYVDFRDGGGRFRGLMSLASGFCLMAFGWSLFEQSHDARDWQERLAWVAAGSLGVVLAFDEVAQFHEAISHVLDRRGVPRLLGFDHDVLVFGLYALIALALVWRLRHRLLELRDALLPALIAVACFVVSQAFDALPWDALSHDTQQWVGACEEAFKCLGSWSLALVGLVLSRSRMPR